MSESTDMKINPYQLCSAYAGYRILRLSLELFIVSHTLKGGFSISMAGTFFVVYSICDVISGSIFLWYPSIFLGSRRRALAFFFLTVGSQVVGFVSFFLSHNFILMVISIGICGLGTSSWFVNYQTLINVAFPKEELKKAASIRQIFEAAGFLLPGLILGVIHSSVHEDQIEQVFSITAYALVIMALLFYIASFAPVVKLASSPSTERSECEEESPSVWAATTMFVKSSLLRYFFLNSILLAMSNILGGTMAIMTTHYFQLEETSLWVGAIGIPIGGIFSAAVALLVGRVDEAWRFYASSNALAVMFVLLFCFTGDAINYFEEQASAAYTTLFFFGTMAGYFFSEIWGVAFACWLRDLKNHSTAFVSRANSFHNIGAQIILAVVFQLQTASLEAIEESSIVKAKKDFLMGGALFGALLLLTLLCFYLYATRPDLINLSKFVWPSKFPHPHLKVKLFAILTRSSLEDMLFGAFCMFRTSKLVDALEDDAVKDGNVSTSEPSRLEYGAFVNILKDFASNNKGKTNDDFYTNDSVVLKNMFLSNDTAFKARASLIEQATSSIHLLTWSLDGSLSVDIARQLISKKRQGLDIKVMIDGVNFYYLCLLLNTTEGGSCHLMVLKMLTAEGIEVRYLLEDGESSSYMCGNHRKILLVDDHRLIAGGRNVENSYLKDEGTFQDSDVLLEGDFANTAHLLSSFWDQGTDIVDIIGDCQHLNGIYDDIKLGKKTDANPRDQDRRSSFKNNAKVSTVSTMSANLEESYIKEDPIEDHTMDQCQLIQLNHVTGNTSGLDIIYTTLLNMIKCASVEVNLVFGYFQLFPQLEEAILAAIKRGVKVRLFTNSSDTGDLYFYAPLFAMAQAKLLEMGAEVYVLDAENNTTEVGVQCAHYKFMTVDNRAVLTGSWNCIGSSIFHDSEYAMLLFGDEESCGNSCRSFNGYWRVALDEGLYTRLDSAPAVCTFSPFLRIVFSKQAVVEHEAWLLIEIDGREGLTLNVHRM